jgi:hypothetical protein
MGFTNYYELIHKSKKTSLTKKEIGEVIATSILDNANKNTELYFSSYIKEFKKKENNRIFSSLEKAIETQKPEIEISDLRDMYEQMSGKTTQVVRKINFAYDALNFFLSYNNNKLRNKTFECLFTFLSNQVHTLSYQKNARQIRGMTKESPEYLLEKPKIINTEYDFFIKGLRNTLIKKYGAPLS